MSALLGSGHGGGCESLAPLAPDPNHFCRVPIDSILGTMATFLGLVGRQRERERERENERENVGAVIITYIVPGFLIIIIV